MNYDDRCSIRWIEESLWHLVHEVSVAYETGEESADVVRDQQEVADQFTLVIVEIHVIQHVRLTVRQEQEVGVVCTLLTSDPHYPAEYEIEVGQEHVFEV